MVIHVIWREHNLLIFQQVHYEPDRILKKITIFLHTKGGELKHRKPILQQLNKFP